MLTVKTEITGPLRTLNVLADCGKDKQIATFDLPIEHDSPSFGIPWTLFSEM